MLLQDDSSDASPGDSIISPMASQGNMAHVSDYAPKMIVPSHQNSTAPAGMSSSSPIPGESSKATTIVKTVVNGTKGYVEQRGVDVASPEQFAEMPNFDEVEKTPERKEWRLAAGYFAFFMCGWGDGSK